MSKPLGTKNLTTEERIKLLVKNHKKYFNSIILNFANQYHQLASELEKELRDKK